MKKTIQARLQTAYDNTERLWLHARRELSDEYALRLYVRALRRCDILTKALLDVDKTKLKGTEF
jgi:hypothetical protein